MKAKNPLNKSSAKAQYSFSKAERFPSRAYSSESNLNFYDIEQKKYDKNISFGSSKRSVFNANNGVPASTTYYKELNKKLSQSVGIMFKAGREVINNNNEGVQK